MENSVKDKLIVNCAECQSYVEARLIGRFERASNGRGPSTRYTLLSCSTCQAPILIRQTNVGNLAEGDIWDKPQPVYPAQNGELQPNAPREIQRALDEANACFRAEAFTASAIMCRKIVEGVCIAHAVKKKTLAASLQEMKDCGQIDERLFEWADSLRIAGNEAAHGVDLTITRSDAKDILEFTNAILDYLFSFRDKFEQFKARRKKMPLETH